VAAYGPDLDVRLQSVFADNLRFELPDDNGGGGTPTIPLPPAVMTFPLAALLAYVAGKRRRHA
jgi:hypothetical protein